MADGARAGPVEPAGTVAALRGGGAGGNAGDDASDPQPKKARQIKNRWATGRECLDMALKPNEGSPDALCARGGQQRIPRGLWPAAMLELADDVSFAASCEGHSHDVGQVLAEEADCTVT